MKLEVEIPDDDLDAVLTVRQVAALLEGGHRVLLLRRPDVPMEQMPALAARLLATIAGAEWAARVHASAS